MHLRRLLLSIPPLPSYHTCPSTHMSPFPIQSIFLLMPSTVAHECTPSDTYIDDFCSTSLSLFTPLHIGMAGMYVHTWARVLAMIHDAKQTRKMLGCSCTLSPSGKGYLVRSVIYMPPSAWLLPSK